MYQLCLHEFQQPSNMPLPVLQFVQGVYKPSTATTCLQLVCSMSAVGLSLHCTMTVWVTVAAGSAAKSEVLDLTADTACEVCSSADDADHMLLCDMCNRGYHLACLVPLMPSIPAGDWFCQTCEAERAGNKGKGTVGIAQKCAAARALVTDSDTDADDFQAPPSKPAVGRLTSRQGTLLSKHCRGQNCLMPCLAPVRTPQHP